MEEKSLHNTTANGAKKNVKDIIFCGNGDTFKLISNSEALTTVSNSEALTTVSNSEALTTVSNSEIIEVKTEDVVTSRYIQYAWQDA
jgi:hypothetical protein